MLCKFASYSDTIAWPFLLKNPMQRSSGGLLLLKRLSQTPRNSMFFAFVKNTSNFVL